MRSIIRSIPLRRAAVLTHRIADVLDAAEDRKHLAAGATVLGSELAGKALAVAKAPVDDQPGEAIAVNGPAPRRPDESGVRTSCRQAW